MAQTNKISIFFIIVLNIFMFNSILHCQTVNLSKQKMYAEFDSLISIIKTANPHLKIYEAMDYNVIEKLKEQRERIKDVKNIFDFYNLIDYALHLIPEGHCRLVSSRQLERGSYLLKNYPYVFDKSTVGNIRKIDKIQSKYSSKPSSTYMTNMMKYFVKMSYIDGEYYLTVPLKIFGETDTTIINIGQMLTKINDIPVHDFFIQNREEYDYIITFANAMTRWDLLNNRFYNEGITMPFHFIINNIPMYLTFFNKATNEEIKFSCANKNLAFTGILGEHSQYERMRPIVKMIDSILFIKIPTMNMENMSVYENEIPAIAGNSKIKKVIIDIRGNRGGSDNVWQNILSLITDTVLYRHAKLGMNDNNIFNSYLKDYFSVPIGSFPLYHDSQLNKDYRLLSEDKDSDSIKVHEKSIRYKGKIYVLHDKNSFSAANAFVTFAVTNDKVVAVGEATGLQGGYGVTPFVYKLPYTKLCFRMHSVIHFPPESNDIKNYFWNKTEIDVIPTAIYENIMHEYERVDIYNKNFLYKYDVFFQTAVADKEY